MNPLPELYGLVLSGGESRRMGKDKGSLHYHGISQRLQCANLLRSLCRKVFLSVRSEQSFEEDIEPIHDELENIGPASGLLAAHKKFPSKAWMILPVDFPNMTEFALQRLQQERGPEYDAISYDPLLAIWEPGALKILELRVQRGDTSPRRALETIRCKYLSKNSREFENVNEFRIASES